MPKLKGLSPKERRFVSEYLKDGNATRSAIRAGYSAKTAAQMGYKLVHKSSVAEAIAKGQAKLLQHAEMSAQDMIAELTVLAKGDMGHVASWTNDDVKIRRSSKIDTRTVKELTLYRTTTTIKKKNGDEMTTVSERRGLKLYDRHAALRTLTEVTGVKAKDGVPGSGGGVGELPTKTYHPDDWAKLEALPKMPS